jgi:hypothetical protein
MVSTDQPWLDGYCVEKGTIRQFVAMPIGSGYSAEEQITGDAQYGGIQIIVYPMKKEAFKRLFPKIDYKVENLRMLKSSGELSKLVVCGGPGMGLAAGGRMKQEIYEDPFHLDDWDMSHGSRCFVHIANSLVWRSITGETSPTVPFTAKEYTRYGLPWFEYYSDNAAALNGSKELEKLKSVTEMAKGKGDVALPENESVDPKNIVKLRKDLVKDQVREGSF